MPQTRHAAIITGSTSGIGRAIAIRLLGSGHSVMLNYSSADERARETLDRCRQISPHVELAKADIRDADAVAALTRRAIGAFGRIDVLINNAARVIDRPALEMTEQEWDTVLDVNLKGAFLCSQHAARHMLEEDEGGVILNIGASTGIRGRRNGANTCASKAGLMMLTQCLALELAPKVRVNTIVPGLTVTEETEQRFGLHDPAVRRAREESIPMRRLGSPEDVADAVMLMLADESRFITGQKLVVDGGQYMWLAPRATRCLARCHVKGQRNGRLSGAGREVHSPSTGPAIVSVARNLSREPALTEPGRPGPPPLPDPAAAATRPRASAPSPEPHRGRPPPEPAGARGPGDSRPERVKGGAQRHRRRRRAAPLTRAGRPPDNRTPDQGHHPARKPGQEGAAVSRSQDKVRKPRTTEQDASGHNRI